MSIASLFKYPLCWTKLHVSCEITHDYPPSHIILSESLKIKRYCKQISSILIDIKIPASGRPTVEVELLDDSGLDDFSKRAFLSYRISRTALSSTGQRTMPARCFSPSSAKWCQSIRPQMSMPNLQQCVTPISLKFAWRRMVVA